MEKTKRKGSSGIKILIGIVAYIAVFAGFLMYNSYSTNKNMMEIKTMADLETAYQTGAKGKIVIEEFIELGPVTTITYETVKKGNVQVKEKRYHTTKMRGADFDTGYVLLIDYHSASAEKFKDDPKAFVMVDKLKEYEFQQNPFASALSQDDYVLVYRSELGDQIINGTVFFVISVVIIGFVVHFYKKRINR